VSFFAQLETACANAVERAFAVAFPSALEPVHVARKLVASFESNASPAARSGRRFTVRMSPNDFARLGSDLPYLERQWTAMLARLAERSGRPQRAPEVRAEAADTVANGTVAIVVETLAEPTELALCVRRGLPLGARYALVRSPVIVGRESTCDVVLADPRASRRHAELVRDGNVWRVRDLGSSNGTLLNAEPIVDAELGLGDVLRVGDSELVVEPGGGAA
jgi:hypothetical protein